MGFTILVMHAALIKDLGPYLCSFSLVPSLRACQSQHCSRVHSTVSRMFSLCHSATPATTLNMQRVLVKQRTAAGFSAVTHRFLVTVTLVAISSMLRWFTGQRSLQVTDWNAQRWFWEGTKPSLVFVMVIYKVVCLGSILIYILLAPSLGCYYLFPSLSLLPLFLSLSSFLPSSPLSFSLSHLLTYIPIYTYEIHDQESIWSIS